MMWEKSVDIFNVQEIRGTGKVYFGCGAIDKIDAIAEQLEKSGITHVLVVTGHSAYKRTGAWGKVEGALKAHNIDYALYDKVTPNPTTGQVDSAAALGFSHQSQAVIAIGGGSPIDAGKSAAILLANPGKTASELYEYEFVPERALPIIAINLTHGTGTECDRFAVVTILKKNYKPAIAYDCIYPKWSIDDPELMTGLSEYQTRFVSIDAVNHVIEGATSIVANPFSITLAAETIRLVVQYLPIALRDPKNLEARYFLLYASMIAGMSFDNGMLHYTHALEHPLSAVKPELTHGLGLSMLLPSVVKNIYPSCPARLAGLLQPMVPGLKGEPGEALTAALGVERWLRQNGAPEKLADLGFSEKDIDRLVELAFETPALGMLLSLAPTMADEDTVRGIYADALYPLSESPAL